MFWFLVSLYICVMLVYILLFCLFDNSEKTPWLFLLYSIFWPLIFSASLFALPFVALVKLVREDDKNDTRTSAPRIFR